MKKIKTNIIQIKNILFTIKGFTILELLIVVTIIGILGLITFVSYSAAVTKAAEVALKSDLENTATTLDDYYLKNLSYPESLDLLNDGSGAKKSPDTNYDYTAIDDDYCLTASSSNKNASAYNISSANNAIIEGYCYGHINPNGGEWKEFSSSYYHSCRISYDDTLYCWGGNENGRLGNGSNTSSLDPVAVRDNGAFSAKKFKSVKTNYLNSCAIDTNDKLYCWGNNQYNTLGNGMISESHFPVAVDASGVLNGKIITQLTLGQYHGCALTTEQLAYCWGYNYFGQLGNNMATGTKSAVPVAVNTGALVGKQITAISAGTFHTCAMTTEERVYCWGSNQFGQVGDNAVSGLQSNVPVAVDTSTVLSGKRLTAIDVAGDVSCALTSEGKVYCWGFGEKGQLGDGNGVSSFVPVAVDTSGVLNGKNISAISMNAHHMCAIDTGHKVYCWGESTTGQLGNRVEEPMSLLPVAILDDGILAGKTLTAVEVGGWHTCVIDSEADVYCWGYNVSGQLGDGTNEPSLFPVKIKAS